MLTMQQHVMQRSQLIIFPAHARAPRLRGAAATFIFLGLRRSLETWRGAAAEALAALAVARRAAAELSGVSARKMWMRWRAAQDAIRQLRTGVRGLAVSIGGLPGCQPRCCGFPACSPGVPGPTPDLAGLRARGARKSTAQPCAPS